MAYKVSEKNRAENYTETLTNSAEFGIISQRDYFEKDISNSNNISGYYIVRSNDYVYNPRISNLASVGPINRNKLGRIGIVSPLYTVFRTDSAVNYEFLDQYFKSSSWHAFMKLNGDSGARSDRLAIKDLVFFQMPVTIPSLEEQKRIGDFLSSFDDTIALHQRKYFQLLDRKIDLLLLFFSE